jgi:ATP-dependent exoDNAse (exonuclease V) beta subunit
MSTTLIKLNLLEKKNPHPRDANITFEPVAHKYTIGGGPERVSLPSVYATIDNELGMMSHRKWQNVPYISVTTWLHSHFEHFDADAIITGMMASKKWPSSQYYGKTREEIKMTWEKNRDEAARLGTEMHETIECYYNGAIALAVADNGAIALDNGAIALNNGAIAYFMNYIKTHALTLVPYRTEWMVYDEEVRIAGSIDMLYEDPSGDGSLMIYDWKRAKEIKKINGFEKYSTTECINHLPDTNFWHYALQLNIYKAIIERNYGKKVTTLMLVCLHPNNKNGDYILFRVPDLQTEICDLFELRKKELLSIYKST